MTTDSQKSSQDAPGSVRTIAQNKKMWAMLKDVSQQVRWMVDGREVLISKEDWKDLFSAWILRYQRVANGIDGGVVLLGQKTSKMSPYKMGQMILGIYAFGDQRGVRWKEPKLQSLLDWAEEQIRQHEKMRAAA